LCVSESRNSRLKFAPSTRLVDNFEICVGPKLITVRYTFIWFVGSIFNKRGITNRARRESQR
jgi:hypothetical protein